VDGGAVLEALARLPIATWSFRTQDPAVRHLGPVAEEFYAAFGLGVDDQHISTADADGVALAAIQGLYHLVREREAELARLAEARDTQIAALEARLAALEQIMAAAPAR
jgi:hypothetical protein